MTLLYDVPDSMERQNSVIRLYQIVLGRLPDSDGLANYLSQPGGQTWYRKVAASLLASDEFCGAVGSESPTSWVLRNARPKGSHGLDGEAPLIDLVCSLARREDVVQWLSTVRARYPDGVSIDDQEAYPLWLAERREQRALVIRPEHGSTPLLSVILYGPVNTKALEASLASIALQRDQRVEVIVVLERATDRLTQAHKRSAALPLRVVRARFSRSPTAALNKAVRAGRAEFVCLLHSGDCLDEAAVAELALAANQADVLLADTDCLQNGMGFAQPAVTGGWDAEAALARPPDSLVVVRTALLKALGGFRPLASGEQAWDILLRASAGVEASRIRHVPAVLLHRASRHRAGRHSAGRDIVRCHLDRTDRGACRVEGDGVSDPIRVIYPLPATPPLASVIIATRDRASLLRTCLVGLLHRTTYPTFEVLILDNDSREADTAELLRSVSADPRVSVLPQPGPFNWSALNNAAVQQMRGEVAVLLNNDTDVIEPNWLRELASQAIRPSVGIVGAKLLYPDRTIQHAGVGMGPCCRSVHVWRHADGAAPGYLDQLRIVRSVAAVTGACLAVRRNVFREVGGLDQDHLQVTWSDTDLCMRVRAAGYKVVWTPHALLYHVELATRGSDDRPEAKIRFSKESATFRARWKGFADRDPFFSPSLVMDQATPWLKTIDDTDLDLLPE